jgi:transcriptional regulator with XRE-family HTH domain
MESEAGDIPVERVTVDQVVARNIRHWRRAAGLTQEELGQKLGWSAPNVSAAETSANPARDPRRFDAQTLAHLSLALGVPLGALFLPPPDDGERAEYIFTGPDREYDMSDLMACVVMPDSEEDTVVMDAYRQRLRMDVGRYCDPSWQPEVGRWLRDAEEPERRSDRAERLRVMALQIRAERDREARELESLADAIDPSGDAR